MRRITYIHELPDWPRFVWDEPLIFALLASVRHRQGRLLGRMESLGFTLQSQATCHTLTLDVLKSSEIEGEILHPEQVRSSVARRLGLKVAGLVPSNRHVDGVVEMLLDATQNHQKPLTQKRLLGWHAALFRTGTSGMHNITTGSYRNSKSDPMQVVSGAMGHEHVHFEAPPSSRLKREMTIFLDWFNGKSPIDDVLKAALAHLWFVTLHPFDDGNGRIARAIGDLQLARSEKCVHRFYSLSSQILLERKTYYAALEKSQKGTLDVTEWLQGFLNCLDRAFLASEITLKKIWSEARFWDSHRKTIFNPRQRLVLGRLLNDFVGKLTSSKWAKIAKCSQDTALRDIQELLVLRILIKEPAGGRSTAYCLKK